MSNSPIALVTGATGNMGKSVTAKLLEDGYSVIGTSLDDNQFSDFNSHSAFKKYKIDVSNKTEVERLISYLVKNFGGVDFATLLVGGFAMGTLSETSLEDINKMYQLNFVTAFLCSQQLFTQMKKQPEGGHIVLVGARPALDPSAGASMVSYALSKSLIFELSKIINASTDETNVRSSVIVPSVLDTSPNRESMPDADFSEWVTPEQVAEAVSFLASKKSSSLRQTVLKLYADA